MSKSKGSKTHRAIVPSRSGVKSGATHSTGSLTGVVHRETTVVEQYSGPIPSAGEIKKYEDVLPGAADRILGMAEQQAAHRQSLETSVIQSNVANSKRGQLFAFIISMTALIAGFVLILCDKNGLGISIIIADLVTLVTVFTGNRISESRELSRKRRDIESDKTE